MSRGATALALLVAGCASTASHDAIPEEYKLLFSQDFESAEELEMFFFSDPAAWRWVKDGDRGALELVGGGSYQPPFRSPREIALLTNYSFWDFVLEVDMKQTGREYGHRDLCLFFGYEAPERFYYAHLATTPDDRAMNVFLVDNADRRRVGEISAEGVDWGDDVWHRVRLVRTVDPPRTRVYFDDMTEPVLDVDDDTLSYGRVGFGSFDDSGRMTRVRLWAVAGAAIQDSETAAR